MTRFVRNESTISCHNLDLNLNNSYLGVSDRGLRIGQGFIHGFLDSFPTPSPVFSLDHSILGPLCVDPLP